MALLTAATGGLTACGDDDNSPPQDGAQEQSSSSRSPQPAAGGSTREQVAGTANAYLSALNEGDGDKACAQLTELAKLSFISKANEASSESRSCEEVVRRYSDLYLSGQISDPHVSKVRVNGTLATVEGPSDVPLIPHVLRLTKEGDRWLLLDAVKPLRQSQQR